MAAGHSQEQVDIVENPTGEHTCSSPSSTCSCSSSSIVTRLQEAKSNAVCSSGGDEYIIVKVSHMTKMWNVSTRQHINSFPECTGDLSMNKLEQRILSTSWNLSCKCCKFEGPKYRMYDTQHADGPGVKPSTLNATLGLSLVASPIGASAFSEIFLTMGLFPGSLKGLTNLINSSAETVQRLGEENMAAERHKLAQYTDGVSVEVDTGYNNPLFGGTKTPFQYGTQSKSVMCENMTPEKKIIDVIIENKLCAVGARLRNKGEDVYCPNGHPGHCSATLAPTDPIGREGLAVEKSCEKLKAEGIKISTATMDGDGSKAGFIQKVFPDVLCQRDSAHLGKALRNAVITADFSNNMFPGRLKAQRTKSQQWLANDVKQRCAAEMTHGAKSVSHISDHDSRTYQLCTLLSDTPQAIVDCYAGNCQLCTSHSFACKGNGSYSWRKHFMSTESRNKLNMTDSDKQKLKDIILDKRLCPKKIGEAVLNANTQKCESIMKCLTRSNPKSVTSSRNVAGRTLAGVLYANEGQIGRARILQTAARHSVSGKITKTHTARSNQREYLKAYKKRKDVIEKRVFSAVAKYRSYENRTLRSTRDCYKQWKTHS